MKVTPYILCSYLQLCRSAQDQAEIRCTGGLGAGEVALRETTRSASKGGQVQVQQTTGNSASLCNSPQAMCSLLQFTYRGRINWSFISLVVPCFLCGLHLRIFNLLPRFHARFRSCWHCRSVSSQAEKNKRSSDIWTWSGKYQQCMLSFCTII